MPLPVIGKSQIPIEDTNFFDRPQDSGVGGVSGTIPAGTLTTTTQYTVPAGKKAMLKHYFIQLGNTAAAGGAFMAIEINRGGSDLLLHRLYSITTGYIVISIPAAIPLQAGDLIKKTLYNGTAAPVYIAYTFLIDEIDL